MFNPFNLVGSMFPTNEEPVGLLNSMDFAESESTVKITTKKTTSVSVFIEDGERSMSHEQTETEEVSIELPASMVNVTITDGEEAESEDDESAEEVEVWAFDVSFKKVPQLMSILYGAIDSLAHQHGLTYSVIADNDSDVTFRMSSSDYDTVKATAIGLCADPRNIYRHRA